MTKFLEKTFFSKETFFWIYMTPLAGWRLYITPSGWMENVLQQPFWFRKARTHSWCSLIWIERTRLWSSVMNHQKQSDEKTLRTTCPRVTWPGQMQSEALNHVTLWLFSEQSACVYIMAWCKLNQQWLHRPPHTANLNLQSTPDM